MLSDGKTPHDFIASSLNAALRAVTTGRSTLRTSNFHDIALYQMNEWELIALGVLCATLQKDLADLDKGASCGDK